MKTVSFQAKADSLGNSLSALNGSKPDLAIVFGHRALLEDASNLKTLHEAMPTANLVGCSTSGEIYDDRTAENTLTVMAMQFEATPTKVATAAISGTSDSSKAAGQSLGEALKSDDLNSIMVLSPGLNVNGSALVAGIREACGEKATVFGGLAGDGTDFQKTVTVLNDKSFEDQVVAIGFYGTNLQVGTGSRGGWQGFGPIRKVTKADANVLYELDGKPALELYKQYLGDRADDLPASGLLYPFAILSEDQAETGLIRTILDVSEEEGSLTLAGDLPTNSLVRLMHADNDALIDGAEAAANDASVDDTDSNSAAICVSCVGRRIVMGNQVDDEVESVRDILGSQIPIVGYYSYGEICPFQESGFSELHNQTMTVTVLREDAGASTAA
ncbi:MAG: FIST C-terminal domain-containing protein [Alphaproteobacteria bacterium]|nr:FIST C-terminal domain-containing protein [Alphaproteobacteria bacterium SS10]